MKKHINSIIAIGVLVFIAMACNASFTTANISGIKFGKNDKAEPESKTFNVGEKVYAVAAVSNSMSKTKVRFKLTAENVEGMEKGKEAGNVDVDMSSSGTAIFSFNAFAPGEFKVEATLLDENGKEIDKKSGTVTCKGTAPAPVAPNETKKSDDSKTDDSQDKDSDDK